MYILRAWLTCVVPNLSHCTQHGTIVTVVNTLPLGHPAVAHSGKLNGLDNDIYYLRYSIPRISNLQLQRHDVQNNSAKDRFSSQFDGAATSFGGGLEHPQAQALLHPSTLDWCWLVVKFCTCISVFLRAGRGGEGKAGERRGSGPHYANSCIRPWYDKVHFASTNSDNNGQHRSVKVSELVRERLM